MKLILENWRKFVSESYEKEKDKELTALGYDSARTIKKKRKAGDRDSLKKQREKEYLDQKRDDLAALGYTEGHEPLYSVDDEVAYNQQYEEIDQLVASAEEKPGELVKLKDGMFIMFDGEQYLVYDTPTPADTDDYKDLYYSEDRDTLMQVAMADITEIDLQ